MRTLVLGGARSGKSGWAESLVDAHAPADGRPVEYVATARPWGGEGEFDADFAARIAAHRDRRPVHWRTVDDVDAVEALRGDHRGGGDGSPSPHILLDDVGTWLTHVIDREGLWDSPRGSVAPWADALVDAVAAWPPTGATAPDHGDGAGDGERRDVVKQSAHLIIVTPEVGMGVIPEHRSGRLFRDEIGALNARLAEVCDRVVLVAAGLPLTLKG